MIYTTGTIAINGNTVKGTGTDFSAPLSLIRVGCTLIAISNPIQIFTVTEIKSGTELSVTPAANPAIAAGTKFSILLSDSISVDGLAQDVAETLRFYQEKEDEISSAIDGSNIGLGPEPRDCADISGNPSSYVGFLRIKETTKGFPSVAAGESFLSGFICQRDTTPSYTGVFVGWSTRSLYTYTWVAASGPNWTRHARKDEVDRLAQWGSETWLYNSDNSMRLGLSASSWGCYSDTQKKWIPLAVSNGGTGAADAATARKNLYIPTIGGGEMITIEAPEGVEAGKYYPIIIDASYYGAFKTGYQVDIHTRSEKGEDPMNCNAFTGYVRTGGWSDRRDSGYGYYTSHSANEVALQSICAPGKTHEHLLFVFVEARAFPVAMRLPVGVTATAPAAEVIYNEGQTSEMVVPWGVSDPLSSYKNLIVMFDFRMGRCGFYSATTAGGHYVCSGGSAVLFNGINLGEEVSLTTPKLTVNGMIGSSKGYVAQTNVNWDDQQSDNLEKFKPIVGATNAPVGVGVIGGFHVGFSGNYATQFAGRNSKFYARSFEAGVNKGWCQLATLNTANVWTNTNKFYGHYIVDSSYTHFMRHIPYASTTANIHVTMWGSSGSRVNYEVKAVGTDSDEASLKTLFTAKYLSDGSAALMVGGVVNCTSVTQTSDRDLKDNIQVIGDATEAIRKMNGYTYTLKENGLPYAGVVAQEVMEALPEAVGSFTHYGKALQGPTTDGNELREETRYLNVDYAAVTGLLVQVARETDNRVTELEEENASLRANIAVMDERITKLEALVRQLTGSEK
ncbi:TPA: tail fiber domain-containing protein [Escherichia coli]